MGWIKTTYHQLGSPPHFYRLAGRMLPWIGSAAAILILVGSVWGLVYAPTDFQQGESYRIIFIHVPSAWMSMFIYATIAVCSAIHLIWRMKLADIIARSAAPIGAIFTFVALVTGSLWGKPMWGAWWVWDARLTSELVLLFIYLGYITLHDAIDDHQLAGRAAGILAIVGVVNLPIIHFSVEWWSSLHQGPTVTKFDKPSIHLSMLLPLLVMAIGFQLFFFMAVLQRARVELLNRERRSRWVRKLALEADPL